MFDHDRSAARGEMTARKLIVFKHDSELGNASAYKLFSFGDYEVTIDKENVPAGVTVNEMI